jgi:hypothetical protein
VALVNGIEVPNITTTFTPTPAPTSSPDNSVPSTTKTPPPSITEDSPYPFPLVPTREGTTDECIKWHEVKEGEDCSIIKGKYSISLCELRK